MTTSINQLDFIKKYSYADYLTSRFQERLELIKGTIFRICNALNTFHQRIGSNLHGMLWSEFNNQKCLLFSTLFNVRLFDIKKSTTNKEVFTVVQPYLCVICKDSKFNKRGAIGSSELIIKILSSGNSVEEMKYKYDLYQEVGVLEYWIVNPADFSVLISVLENKIFVGKHPLTIKNKINSVVFPHLDFWVKDIFSRTCSPVNY